MVNQSIILIGYSGHGYVLAETAIENGYHIIGYADNVSNENNPFDLKFLGSEKNENFMGWKKDVSFLIGIGNNIIREKVADTIKSYEKKIESLIHLSASVSKSANIGKGTFINKNVSVNAMAIIGENVILNTGCIIEHDCEIKNYVHVAPGAVLTGGVIIGERTLVGANAVIKQGVKIGKDVIIGAGAVVLQDVQDGTTVLGNPGK